MKNINIDICGKEKCNLSCRFCYQDLEGKLSCDDVLQIVESNPSFERVEIGGGEPFMHEEIVKITKELAKKGKLVHISTNGTLIPDGFLKLEDKLKEKVQIQVSLHASNPVLYQKVTGKELFYTVKDKIQTLKEHYFVTLSSTIYNDNFSDVENIVRLAMQLRTPIRVNLAMPIGKGKDVELLDSKQIDQLTGYLLQERIAKGSLVESPLIHKNKCYALQAGYGIKKKELCPADVGTKKYVSPKGEIYACEFLGGRKKCHQ